MSDFWSRRRAQVAQEAQAEAAAARAAALAERDSVDAIRTDDELLADLDLPDPDTLDAGGDFRAFLADNVPARLQRRALRRLWRVNPALANLDGLVDYGEDYTDAATVVENLQTAYQVGKGMLRHVEALAQAAEAGTDDGPEAANEETDRLPGPDDAPPVVAEVPDVQEPDDADPSDAPARPRRRMQFSFSSEGTA